MLLVNKCVHKRHWMSSSLSKWTGRTRPVSGAFSADAAGVCNAVHSRGHGCFFVVAVSTLAGRFVSTSWPPASAAHLYSLPVLLLIRWWDAALRKSVAASRLSYMDVIDLVMPHLETAIMCVVDVVLVTCFTMSNCRYEINIHYFPFHSA